MFNQHHNKVLKIKRMNAKEMDLAISDLLKRGYVLVERSQSNVVVSYCSASRLNDSFAHQQHWAVLRKEVIPDK